MGAPPRSIERGRSSASANRVRAARRPWRFCDCAASPISVPSQVESTDGSTRSTEASLDTDRSPLSPVAPHSLRARATNRRATCARALIGRFCLIRFFFAHSASGRRTNQMTQQKKSKNAAKQTKSKPAKTAPPAKKEVKLSQIEVDDLEQISGGADCRPQVPDC